MKKINLAYTAVWYGGPLAAAAALVAFGFLLDQLPLAIVGFVVVVAALAAVPGILRKRMEKSALALEKEFETKGFCYQQKFSSNSGIFYIDSTGGRLGVVWKYNPTELYLADLSKITDIHTNDGRQLNGTSLVSCQFKLDGKKFKIYTLRVSNGQLSMKSAEVLEAISKADILCELLKTAKNAAEQSA